LAVRLQMKLGVISEPDRASDSPDTIVVVEPSVGSVARSKGNLYLIVTSTIASARAQEATQLAAETIRGEYYYDESAGIRVCIEKAIGSANKRLGHQRERLGLHGPEDNGPIGIGIAVVRGNELYVATIGPAEAYLIRQARLSTLPDPHRERGLPTTGLEPDVWRGEISVGDSLVLVSPNVMTRLGPDELKDSMVTLHPQPAMEHLHHRFVAADGAGSDAMIAFEATEVASTHKSRSLVPVRPPEPLAGAPDRSPIPLADNVTGGVAAVQASAVRARDAAGNAMTGLVGRLQEFLPHRSTSYRRVTPAAAKREMQRRAAVAILAFVVVVAALGTVVYSVGGRDQVPLASLTAGEAALRTIRTNVGQVFGPGVDLVRDDPAKAHDLLLAAYQAIGAAAAANVPASTLDPLRAQTMQLLDRLFNVVPVAAAKVLTFAGNKPAFDIRSMILGPDGVPYVLDKATASVYRIDLRTKRANLVFRSKTHAAGGIEGVPRLLATGARDLLIVDDKNVIWRWRAKDTKGNGTIKKILVNGSSGWGNDVVRIGTFLRDAANGYYNLYVVDPSEQNIRVYFPASDGAGFPSKAQPWLTVPHDVSQVTDLYIDGDVFLVDTGTIARYVAGKSEGWSIQPPGAASFAPDGDALLRPSPRFTLMTAAGDKRVGNIYAYDASNARVVAYDKAKGTFVEQYRLAGGNPAWGDVRGMYVILGPDPSAPATLVWATRDTVLSAVLEPVPDNTGPSPSGSPGPTASGSGPSARPSARSSPGASRAP